MKKIVFGVLMVTAFNGHSVIADDNIWTLDRLRAENPKKLEAQKEGWVFVEKESSGLQGSQTVTLTKLEDQEETQGNVYKDTFITAAGWGATAAGIGLTYLYGPTALFWGTYYGASYALGKLGIAGITGVSAATKAAIMVADSPAAQTALTIAGGYVAKYGATAAVKVAEVAGNVAYTGAEYIASKSWSLGSLVYNSFWGSKPVEKVEKKEPTREEKRELILQATKKRLAMN